MTAENPHAGQGAVMLDIGGDVGAVVVTMPASMDGLEIEIRPVGALDEKDEAGNLVHADRHAAAIAHAAEHAHEQARDHDHDHDHDHDEDHPHEPHHHDHDHDHGSSPWPHVAVVGRPTPSGVVHSLVFGSVIEGSYELYVRPDGPVELVVDVTGGAVAMVTWPTAD